MPLRSRTVYTARYASPEQARGSSVDGKTDVYSLALTLVEAVTGQVPFAADTTVATLMNRLDKLMPVSAEHYATVRGRVRGRIIYQYHGLCGPL